MVAYARKAIIHACRDLGGRGQTRQPWQTTGTPLPLDGDADAMYGYHCCYCLCDSIQTGAKPMEGILEFACSRSKITRWAPGGPLAAGRAGSTRIGWDQLTGVRPGDPSPPCLGLTQGSTLPPPPSPSAARLRPGYQASVTGSKAGKGSWGPAWATCLALAASKCRARTLWVSSDSCCSGGCGKM